jgi:hypothetical protein
MKKRYKKKRQVSIATLNEENRRLTERNRELERNQSTSAEYYRLAADQDYRLAADQEPGVVGVPPPPPPPPPPAGQGQGSFVMPILKKVSKNKKEGSGDSFLMALRRKLAEREVRQKSNPESFDQSLPDRRNPGASTGQLELRRPKLQAIGSAISPNVLVGDQRIRNIIQDMIKANRMALRGLIPRFLVLVQERIGRNANQPEVVEAIRVLCTDPHYQELVRGIENHGFGDLLEQLSPEGLMQSIFRSN